MYKSLPSNSNGEYGFTAEIVGTFCLSIKVGIISTAPPIDTAIKIIL
jgi:hypothetical protein